MPPAIIWSSQFQTESDEENIKDLPKLEQNKEGTLTKGGGVAELSKGLSKDENNETSF